MDKINPFAMGLVLFMVVAFAAVVWRCLQPKKVPCKCGNGGRLLRRQETGQRIILHYSCPCGNVWQAPEPGWEERRENSYS